MSKFYTIFIFIFCLISYQFVFSQNITLPKGYTIKVVAPEGITEGILGMGYNANFNELNFKVFEGTTKTTNEATYQSSYLNIENSSEYSANAKVFSFMKGGFSNMTNKRYAVLSIYFIDKTISFDPKGEPQGSADFYVSKIHYGWSLNYIISGETNTFNIEVSANLRNWVGGDFKSETGKYKLEQELKLKGLTGKDEGVTIAKSEIETLNKFQKSKEPVPILIEYKAVKDVNTQGIKWTSPSPFFKVGNYRLTIIDYTVSDKKDNGRSNWDVGFGDSKYPDVIVKLFINGTEKSVKTGIKNAVSGKVNFDIQKLELRQNTILKFEFWDEDTGVNDKIGEAEISYNELSKMKFTEPVIIQRTTPLINKCLMTLEPVSQ